MTTIENKKAPVMTAGKPADIYYGTLCAMCLNNPPENKKWTVKDMRARLSVLDIVMPSHDPNVVPAPAFNLDDIQLSTLKQCVNDMRWTGLDHCLADFTDYINSL